MPALHHPPKETTPPDFHFDNPNFPTLMSLKLIFPNYLSPILDN
jgi:hypothetical protein